MAFPLTEYAVVVVVVVFSVVFISVIEALSPKDKFYEVYTQRQDKAEYVIDKAMHPKSEEANDALCRCLVERTGVKVSNTDESIYAFISETKTYTFIYEKPQYNIRAYLLTCHTRQESPKLNVAFSDSEDEYFYVLVFKEGPETCRVHCMIRIPGLEDNDQEKLSQSPYWCRVAAKMRYKLRAYIPKKNDIDPKITEEEKNNSLIQDMKDSHEKTSDLGIANNKDRENLSSSTYGRHTAAQSIHASEARSDIVTKIPMKKCPFNEPPHMSVMKKKYDSGEETSDEEPLIDKRREKPSHSNNLYHTGAEAASHASAAHTEKKNDTVTKMPMKKSSLNEPPHMSVMKKKYDSDEETSDEEPLIDKRREKPSHNNNLYHTGAEAASHASAAHTKKKNDIVTKMPMKKSSLNEPPYMSVIEKKYDSDEEAWDEEPSNDNKRGRLSQSTYLYRNTAEASCASVAHTKMKSDIVEITKKKRPLYAPQQMPVLKKNNDSDEDISDEEPSNQPLPTKPSKVSIDIESEESSDTNEEPSNQSLPMKQSKVSIEMEDGDASDMDERPLNKPLPIKPSENLIEIESD